MLSLSRSAVWRLTKDPSFPRPRRLGGAVRWERCEVEQWVRSYACDGTQSVRPVSYLRSQDCDDDLDMVLIPA